MNSKVNAFQALVYRLEAHVARTETTLSNLKLQLEAARAMATDPAQQQLPIDKPRAK